MSSPDLKTLLLQLLNLWSWRDSPDYYLKTLAPAIIRNDPSIPLTAKEYGVVYKIKRLATSSEWTHLAELLEDSMDERLHELAQLDEEAAIRWQNRSRILRERRNQDLADTQARLEQIRERQERELATTRGRREAIHSYLKAELAADFLNAEQMLWMHPDATFLDKDDVKRVKREVVKQWSGQYLDHELDDEQLDAVAATHTNVLIAARAGSGKTRTLTSRALFLLTHCHVDPNELLIVAFNNKAVDEIRNRLRDATEGPLPHIRTFHSLAYGIENPAETLLDEQSKRRLIQRIIDDHMADNEQGALIRELMTEHFRSDWEDLALRESGLLASESLRLARLLPRETLRGEYVKSYGEKLIANVLFENGIDYRYERPFAWDGRRYRPDFTIEHRRDRGVVIEYFGVRGHFGYKIQMLEKRSYWSKKDGWTLVELTPEDVRGDPDEFADELLWRLDRLGIPRTPLSDEEIWQRIRRRAIGEFTRTIETFISRSRKRGLSADDLAALVSQHHSATPTERAFLRVAQLIYGQYPEILKSTESDDFDGLMWRAVRALRKGKTTFVRNASDPPGDVRRIRHVLVDEFQDFSGLFYEIARSMWDTNPDLSFFCVGDDWQAINSFAGSDLRYYTDFSTRFETGERLRISRNYRSSGTIVAAGNALMGSRGAPAVAVLPERRQLISLDLDSFSSTVAEQGRCTSPVLCPALLRVIRSCLDRGENVVLLSRTQNASRSWGIDDVNSEWLKDLDSILKHLLGHLSKEERQRVSISTTHGFKGLESDAVIIIDATDSRYPLVHPTWIFFRVFGDTLTHLENEERRLFYVAITRARSSLYFVTQSTRMSPLLSELRSNFPVLDLDWSSLNPAHALGTSQIEIRVYNGYHHRNALKSEGFGFINEEKCWRMFLPNDCDVTSFLRERPWFRHPVRIELLRNGQQLSQQSAD
jgi:DNA helicase-4